MMKKLAIATIVIMVAALSVAGCTSSPTSSPSPSPTVASATSTVQKASATSTKTPTTSPTAAPTAASDSKSLLERMEPLFVAKYGRDAVYFRGETLYINSESNNIWTVSEISDGGSIDAANKMYKTFPICPSGETTDYGRITHFGQQEATAALGHAPTVVKDIFCRGTGANMIGIDNEYLQYDELTFRVAITDLSYTPPD